MSVLAHADRAGTAGIRSWLDDAAERLGIRAEQVPLDALDGWETDPDSGAVRHRSGRFFSIEGLTCGDRGIRCPTGSSRSSASRRSGCWASSSSGSAAYRTA
nr:NDP-hexose 2,3-dehydratase family protein [Streptomyces sp. Alain-F2R5]